MHKHISRLPNPLHATLLRPLTRRRLSTPPTPPTSKTAQIASKLPKALRPYASRFVNNPVSHITAFVLLHELTAVVPLAGLFWVFHGIGVGSGSKWVPGEWIEKGVERFGRYAQKKGFTIFESTSGARTLVELATAWAIVKALLPFRIGLSLWATPWVARSFVVPLGGLFRRLRPR